jgi:hypothetical protein
MTMVDLEMMYRGLNNNIMGKRLDGLHAAKED